MSVNLSEYGFHNLKSDKHCMAHVQRTSNIGRWHWYHKRGASLVKIWFEVALRLPPKIKCPNPKKSSE